VVTGCDKTLLMKNEIQQHFGMDLGKIPTIALIDSAGKKLQEVFLNTKLDKSKISLWIQKHIAVSRSSGPQGLFKQWDLSDKAVSKKKEEEKECGPKDSKFCFLFFFNHD